MRNDPSSCACRQHPSEPSLWPQVRDAAHAAARAVMANITGPGVKLVLPTLLKGLQEKAWRSKQASIELLGAMSACAPQQLATSLPTVVPALAGVLSDAHPKVRSRKRRVRNACVHAFSALRCSGERCSELLGTERASASQQSPQSRTSSALAGAPTDAHLEVRERCVPKRREC